MRQRQWLAPLPASISQLFSDHRQRLGDRVAETIVVRAGSMREAGCSALSFCSARCVDVLHQGRRVGKLRGLFRFREDCQTGSVCQLSRLFRVEAFVHRGFRRFANFLFAKGLCLSL